MTLTADFINALPDGTRDTSTFQEIESALDQVDAPSLDGAGKWLTLTERIAEKARIDALTIEALRTQLRCWKIEPVL